MPRELVAVQAVHRDEVLGEPALLRGDRPAVALERELVLLAPADPPRLRHLLAVLAHALAGGAVLDLGNVEPHVLRAQRPERREPARRRPGLEEPAQPDREVAGEADLDAARALGSADERQVAARPAEHPGGLERRDHARAALEDGRERRDVRVEAGLEPDLAREVAVGEVDRDRAPDRQVHGAGGLLRHGADDRHREAERVAPRQGPVHAGKRGPHPGREPGRRLLHTRILRSAISSRAKRGASVGHHGPQNQHAPLDGRRLSGAPARVGDADRRRASGRGRRSGRDRRGARGPVRRRIRVGRALRDRAPAGRSGAPRRRRAGRALTEDVCGFCDEVFERGGAVLAGPGGGRFVYDLRRRFDLFCKISPLQPIARADGRGPAEGAERGGRGHPARPRERGRRVPGRVARDRGRAGRPRLRALVPVQRAAGAADPRRGGAAGGRAARPAVRRDQGLRQFPA